MDGLQSIFCLLALFNTEPLDAKGSAINVITKVTIKLLLHVIHTLQLTEGNSLANILTLEAGESSPISTVDFTLFYIFG